jgi:site-specific DNA recombinase
MMSEQVKVAGYERCSSEEQAQEGISMDTQRNYIVDWCQRMKWTLKAIYKDPGFSGKDRERPGLKRMMEDARVGFDGRVRDTSTSIFDMVVAYNNDRLSRDVKDTLSIIDELAMLGIRVKFGIINNVDLGTPEGRFLVSNLAAGAEFYRRDIAQKTKLSMAALKERGRHLGRPPWGFKIGEDGVLTIVDQRVTAIWLRHFWPPHLGVTRIAKDLGMNPRTVEAVVKVRPKVLQAWAAAGIDPASHRFSSGTVERPKPRPA